MTIGGAQWRGAWSAQALLLPPPPETRTQSKKMTRKTNKQNKPNQIKEKKNSLSAAPSGDTPEARPLPAEEFGNAIATAVAGAAVAMAAIVGRGLGREGRGGRCGRGGGGGGGGGGRGASRSRVGRGGKHLPRDVPPDVIADEDPTRPLPPVDGPNGRKNSPRLVPSIVVTDEDSSTPPLQPVNGPNGSGQPVRRLNPAAAPFVHMSLRQSPASPGAGSNSKRRGELHDKFKYIAPNGIVIANGSGRPFDVTMVAHM